MRAALLTAFREPFVVEEVDLLPLASDRVLVKTHASPFCRTDVTSWEGNLGKVPPTILGHSSAGEIVEIGSAVRHLRVGQRVIVNGTPECGKCYYCNAGRPDQCAELFDLSGIFPDIGARSDGTLVSCAGCVGGYAEFMSISQNQVVPVETDLSSEVLALFGCGVSTGYGAAVVAGGIAPGESVVIVGAGQIGLWALQAALLRDPSTVIVVEPDAARRAVATELGASIVLDPTTDDVRAAVLDATEGRGADIAIEAAGAPAAQRDAITLTRRAGRVILIGLETGRSEVTLPQVPFAVQSRTIISIQNGNLRMRRDFPRILELFERGRLSAERIITRRYSLDQLNEAREASSKRSDLTGLITFP